jgi:hypothetical protein
MQGEGQWSTISGDECFGRIADTSRYEQPMLVNRTTSRWRGVRWGFMGGIRRRRGKPSGYSEDF